MSLERMDIATLRRYTKPRLTQISTTQVLLEMIEPRKMNDWLPI